MKATDLMIGDWVYAHHPSQEAQPVKVDAGLLGLMERMLIGFVKRESPLFRIVSAIPLTPEILEKNGWTYNDENSQFHPKTWSGNGIMLKQENEGFRIMVVSEYDDEDTNRTPFVLRYVSDIQHALKLRGKDKEIVL